MISFKLSTSNPTEKYSYGYKKSSIRLSLLNTVILLISIGAIGYESVFRSKNPQPLPGITIAIMAAIGTIVNGVSACTFLERY
jgi:cobalt-zinc-cadmium efflux system protein